MSYSLDSSIATQGSSVPKFRRSFNTSAFQQWWKDNGRAWTQELRSIAIEHRNIGHDWQFTEEQEKLLQQYYDANKLLVDCLNSDCYVSREVREEIE